MSLAKASKGGKSATRSVNYWDGLMRSDDGRFEITRIQWSVRFAVLL
jgi:hypothetical protein